MIVLDTNVVSELILPAPALTVSEWVSRQAREELHTTAVTEGELLFGVLRLPYGRRRSELTRSIEDILGLFSGRILPFDSAAAKEYGAILAHRQTIGRPLERQRLDVQIAAIARANGFAVATRDVADFTDCGIQIINPWEATSTS